MRIRSSRCMLLVEVDAGGNDTAVLSHAQKICLEFLAERSNQFGSSKVPP